MDQRPSHQVGQNAQSHHSTYGQQDREYRGNSHQVPPSTQSHHMEHRTSAHQVPLSPQSHHLEQRAPSQSTQHLDQRPPSRQVASSTQAAQPLPQSHQLDHRPQLHHLEPPRTQAHHQLSSGFQVPAPAPTSQVQSHHRMDQRMPSYQGSHMDQRAASHQGVHHSHDTPAKETLAQGLAGTRLGASVGWWGLDGSLTGESSYMPCAFTEAPTATTATTASTSSSPSTTRQRRQRKSAASSSAAAAAAAASASATPGLTSPQYATDAHAGLFRNLPTLATGLASGLASGLPAGLPTGFSGLPGLAGLAGLPQWPQAYRNPGPAQPGAAL